MCWYRYLIVLTCLITSINTSVKATHVVGAELTYKCLGNDQYQIRIDLYIDCINGESTPIMQDNPAYIGIFDAQNPYLFTIVDSIYKGAEIPVPPNFDNQCVKNPPPTCIRKVSFIKQYRLPSNSRGYRVVYVRCCRNAAITNISKSSEIGATYFCDIPPASNATCNNSAVFKNYPPQIICINTPLVYDHSATDADGDSLSYEFCYAYPGGTPDNPKPWPPDPNIPAPISNYYSPYSAANPMGGNPRVQVNPVSGVISGTPNTQGRFVVTVCCNEWRNGIMINTVKREFQFVVTNCSKAVVANMPQFSDEFNTYIVECKSRTVKFFNTSFGGFSYLWDFGFPGASSTEFEPSYTYPDTGIYTVKLVVNQGSTCLDSISRYVKVYPDYKASFLTEGLLCPHAPIQFLDRSEGTYMPVVSWNWTFGDGTRSVEQNPVHAYGQGGNYNLELTSKNIKGCLDTAREVINIEDFRPFAGNDTIIVKGEHIDFRASCGVTYIWTPVYRLNFTDAANPRGYYPDTGLYSYNVHIKSEFGCEGDDSIHVLVVNDASLFLPTAFTPNGDGKNDKFRPMGVGYADIKFFRVFNRFGEMVFATDKFFEGWDGTYKGQHADMGTYFWVLNVVDRFGKDGELKGDVVLLR